MRKKKNNYGGLWADLVSLFRNTASEPATPFTIWKMSVSLHVLAYETERWAQEFGTQDYTKRGSWIPLNLKPPVDVVGMAMTCHKLGTERDHHIITNLWNNVSVPAQIHHRDAYKHVFSGFSFAWPSERVNSWWHGKVTQDDGPVSGIL